MSQCPPPSLEPVSGELEDRTPKIPVWKFQSTLTPWSILLYPLTTVQTRGVCVPYLLPAGSITPEWLSKEYVPRKPPLLAACTTDSFSITASVVSGTIKSFQLIVSKEGWLGLYRGFGTFLIHGATRDLLVYHSLRLLYVPVRNTFRWLRNTLIGIYRKAIHQQCTQQIVSSRPAVSLTLKTPAALRVNPSIPRSYPAISPVLDLPQILIKAFADMIVYPLLVIGTRLTVYEGPEPISLRQMTELSLSFDGFVGGLYRGFLVYSLNRLADDIVDLVCIRLCRRRQLTWPYTLTIRAGTFTIVGSLTAPLATLGLLQRTQSNIPGLCNPSMKTSELLNKMPWKLLIFNVALTSLIAGFNIALFLAEGRTAGLGALSTTDTIEPFEDSDDNELTR